MTSLFGHFLPKNDQMTQNNALYSNKQNVPACLLDGRRETEETNLLPLVDIEESTTSTSTTKGQLEEEEEIIEEEEEIIRLLEGKVTETEETKLAKKRYK